MTHTLSTFSPTGGTAKTARILASAIASEWQTLDLLNRIPETKFSADDICLIAVPSFGGRIPTLTAERLRCIRAEGTKAILLCVYGNRAYEDTLSELQDIAEEQGFICIAAAAAVAEHSILREFGAGRPDEADAADLLAFGETIRERLEQPDVLPLTVPGAHGTYKPYRNSAFVPAETDACVRCGTCAAECPADAIGDTPDAIDPDRCIKCMRCAAVCPTGARQLDPALLDMLRERLSAVCAVRKENELFL